MRSNVKCCPNAEHWNGGGDFRRKLSRALMSCFPILREETLRTLSTLKTLQILRNDSHTFQFNQIIILKKIGYFKQGHGGVVVTKVGAKDFA